MRMKLTSKNMMRTAAVLLCGAALALPALAQSGSTDGGQGQQQGPPPGGGPGGRRGGPEQRLAMMTKELSLSTDQQAKIKTILEDGRAKMMAERGAGDGRGKMMETMKAENESIKAVLTDDQKVKFEAMQKRQMERMRERQNGEGGGPPPAPPQQ